jgi:hypothetical protein
MTVVVPAKEFEGQLWIPASIYQASVKRAVEEEREACAKVCDEQEQRSRESSEKSKRERDKFMYHHCAVTAKWNAAAIRARGEYGDV